MATSTNMHKAAVANNGTVSAAIPLDGNWLLSISFPAGLDATAFTIQTSMDGGSTFQTFYKDGADKSFTVAAEKNVDVSDHHIIADQIKIVLGTQQSPAITLTALAMRLE